MWNPKEVNYKEKVDKIIKAYNKAKNLDPKINYRRHLTHGPHWSPASILSTYPIKVIINKFKYEPEYKKVIRLNYTTYKRYESTAVDKDKYGKYLESKLDSGELTPSLMETWWKEFDEDKYKTKWLNAKYIISRIKFDKMWNPYNIEDGFKYRQALENPSKLSYYSCIDYGTLGYSERSQVRDFLKDENNQADLRTALVRVRKKLYDAKPSIKDGIKARSQYMKIDYKDLINLYMKEQNQGGYYQGANSRTHEAEAVLNLISKDLSDYFGVNLNVFIGKDDDDDYVVMASVNDDADETKLKEVYNKIEDINVTVKCLGVSDHKDENVTVVSSSFTEYYYDKFQVTISYNGTEVSDKLHDPVAVGSYFYSGGWN